MPAKSVKDSFSQRIALDFIESSADPDEVHYRQFLSNFSATDRKGIIIKKVQYTPIVVEASILGVIDAELIFGLSFVPSSMISLVSPQNVGPLDWNRLGKVEDGTPATSWPLFPIVKDFSNLSGGGILAHPSSLFAYLFSSSTLATPAVLTARMAFEVWFDYIDLTEELYRELWEIRVLANGF